MRRFGEKMEQIEKDWTEIRTGVTPKFHLVEKKRSLFGLSETLTPEQLCMRTI